MYFKIPHHGANQGSGMSLFLHTFCSYTVCSMGKSTEGLADKSAFERGDDLRSRCLSQRTTSYSIPFCHVPRSLLLELAFLGEHLFTGQI